MKTWHIALIAAAAVAVIGGGIGVTVWALRRAKKQAATTGCAPCALARARAGR